MEVTQEIARLHLHDLVNEALYAVLGILVPLAFLATGAASRARAALERRIPPRAWLLTVALLFLGYSAAVWLMLTPLHWWREYLLDRQFGLTELTSAQWLRRNAIDTATYVAFSLPLAVAGYAMLRRWPRRWMPIMVAALTAWSFALAVVSPAWIDPLFADYGPLENARLDKRIRELAASAGIQRVELVVQRVRDRNEMNAYVSGFFSEPRIVFTERLVRRNSEDEIVQLAAHEIGHHVLRHSWIGFLVWSAIAAITIAFVAWAAPRVLARYGPRWGVRDLADPASLPLVLLLLEVAALVTDPLYNAYSREKERAADRYELTLARNVQACVSRNERFHRTLMEHPDPPPAVVWLLHTHPTLKERVARCRGEIP